MTRRRMRAFLIGSAVTAVMLVVGLFAVPMALAASCFTDTGGHWAET